MVGAGVFPGCFSVPAWTQPLSVNSLRTGLHRLFSCFEQLVDPGTLWAVTILKDDSVSAVIFSVKRHSECVSEFTWLSD